MPHNHIFMQQSVVDELLTKTTTGYYFDRYATIEWLVAQMVKGAFRQHAGEELDDDQVVRYDMHITNSMPVDMAVNVTAWYTPERAPHFEAIRREVMEQLQAWVPALNIEVHLVVVGSHSESGSSRARVSAGMVHEIAEGDADFRRTSRGR